MTSRKTITTPKLPASQLLPLARQIDHACQSWWPKLRDQGSLDIESIAHMEGLRVTLLASTPATPTDAAIVLGAINSVASFVRAACINSSELDADATHILASSSLEMLIGMRTLMIYLESTGAQSPEALGLFQSDQALQ